MAEPAADTAARDQRIVSEAALEAARLLGLSQSTLGRILGVSTSSVSRMKKGTFRLPSDGKQWELAVLLIRVYRALSAICADDSSAMRAWMSHYNRDLAAVPIERLRTVDGLVDVLEYLDAHRAIT